MEIVSKKLLEVTDKLTDLEGRFRKASVEVEELKNEFIKTKIEYDLLCSLKDEAEGGTNIVSITDEG